MLFFSLNFIISFGVYRLDIYMVCRTIPLMMALSLAWPPPPPHCIPAHCAPHAELSDSFGFSSSSRFRELRI